MKIRSVLALFLLIGATAWPAALLKSARAFVLPERDLFPEGIAFDPVGKTFYLSSVHKRKIVAITEAGGIRDFIPAGYEGFLSGLGMKVDASRRELWALAIESRGDRHRSRAFVFDIESGRVLRIYEQPDGGAHLFNDVAVAKSGQAYLTDSEAHAVYRIPPGGRTVVPFVQSAEEVPVPNGIALSADEKTLFVASDTRGLLRVETGTGRVQAVSNTTPIPTVGIDGLAREGYGLYAVVNADPALPGARIVRFGLNAPGTAIVRAEILDEANPAFEDPTTCLVAGGVLFVVANSQLRQLDKGRIRPDARLKDIVILRYALGPDFFK